MKKVKLFPLTVLCRVIALITLIFGLAASPSLGAESMNQDAERILQSMSSYMAGLKAFSLKADVDFEIVTQQGQKLQFSSWVTAVIERPANLHITRKGVISDSEYYYDGNFFTIYGKNFNAYSQIEGSGTIDDAFIAYEYETGLPAPGADLLFADPYATLSSGIESGEYMGTAYVNGVECHHLAFRNAKTDWQLWVKVGDQAFPMKYVITTKWVTGAPQYQIRLRDWDINPKIKTGEFSFSAPDGAQKLDTFPADELDGITFTEESS